MSNAATRAWNLSMNRRQVLLYLGLGTTSFGCGQAVNSALKPKTSNSESTTPSQKPAVISSPAANTLPEIAVAGRNTMPEFQGISHWFNSDPLTVSQLKGKVVLLQFWTFGCINCIRTLPYVVKWNQKYAAKGLQVVGVHTPEFGYERELNNIQQALKKHNITYSVPVDNDFKTWRAYQNEYWPHLFLADRNGILRYDHIGEGAYDTTETMIQRLLG